MTRSEAFELLKSYYNKPVFNVKVGMCSPQCVDVDFETALAEMDRCSKRTTAYWEFVFIYPSDYVKDAEALCEALTLFNLGGGRGSLNTKIFT